MEPTPEIQAAVRAGAEETIRSFRKPRDRLAAARYLATMSWLAVASQLADEVVVEHRRDHPLMTYEETATMLEIHPSTVNRSVVRFNRRWHEPTEG